MALVVVEQPAAFVDGMVCFDGCHGHHDILHCSVVGTAGFLQFTGAFIIVLHTHFFHCCHCVLVSHTHLYLFYTWCTKCKNKYIFGRFILQYIFLGMNCHLYSVGFCSCMHFLSILNIFKFLHSVYTLWLCML